MSVGLNAGAYIYQGDLTLTPLALQTIMPAFIICKKPLNHFLAARLHTSFALLKGNESRYSKPEYRQQRNFSFYKSCYRVIWTVGLEYLGRNYDDYGIMPYVFSEGRFLYTAGQELQQDGPGSFWRIIGSCCRSGY
jgi:hypothetical protein